MAAGSSDREIDTLMEEASQALAGTAYFEAERLAEKALSLAWKATDFDRMARIIMPLQEARRQRYQQALDVGRISIVDTPDTEDGVIEPGCYLFQPPQVGAGARRFRLAAREREIPVAVVCREPLTILKLCPVVAIGPGITIRTRVDPPEDHENIDMAWFTAAMRELGDFALCPESLDPSIATRRRLDALLSRLDAIPEHEGLHHAVEETCREREREKAADEEKAAAAAAGRDG